MMKEVLLRHGIFMGHYKRPIDNVFPPMKVMHVDACLTAFNLKFKRVKD